MEPLPFRKGCEAHALNLVSRPFLGADYVDPLKTIHKKHYVRKVLNYEEDSVP